MMKEIKAANRLTNQIYGYCLLHVTISVLIANIFYLNLQLCRFVNKNEYRKYVPLYRFS